VDYIKGAITVLITNIKVQIIQLIISTTEQVNPSPIRQNKTPVIINNINSVKLQDNIQLETKPIIEITSITINNKIKNKLKLLTKQKETLIITITLHN
jgi:hypothetical protein